MKWIAADGERAHLLVTTSEGCVSNIYSSLLQFLPGLRLHRYSGGSLFLICKLAKNVLRCFRERKLIVMTWLLHWKALQPDLNMMLSVSRAKNRGTKGEG